MSQWSGSDPERQKPEKGIWSEFADALGCFTWIIIVAFIFLLVAVWDPLVAAVTRWLQ